MENQVPSPFGNLAGFAAFIQPKRPQVSMQPQTQRHRWSADGTLISMAARKNRPLVRRLHHSVPFAQVAS